METLSPHIRFFCTKFLFQVYQRSGPTMTEPRRTIISRIPNDGRRFHTDSGTAVRGKFLWFREIGRSKFMVLQRFKGKISLHIRNYILDEEEYVYIPTKRGVTMDKQQVKDLIVAAPDLERVIQTVSSFSCF